MLPSPEFGQGAEGAGEQVEQRPVRVQAHLVQAVEAAKELELTRGQTDPFPNRLDGLGKVGKVDGHRLQCGHPG
ncbi:hypothetical protein KCMC57_up02640 [Kitasatospora sp. CMC57]